MHCRVVSLLLLPSVLLTQSAVLGHAHRGGQPAGHDLRPHFHSYASSAPHPHHHGPDGHDRHLDDGDDAPEPVPQPSSENGHASDAVHVCVDAVVKERIAVDEVAALLGWAGAGLRLPIAFFEDTSPEAVKWTHAPPPSGYGCALYLRQLTLLI